MDHLRLRSFAATFAALLGFFVTINACGGGDGGGGDEQGGEGGDGDEGGSGGDESPSGGKGGGGAGKGGGGGSQSSGGKGGGSSTGGSAAGGSSTGGSATGGSSAGGSGGAATGGSGGMAGAAGADGAMGGGDKGQEHVWIDADITFGPNGSIEHAQPSNWFAPVNYYNGSMEVRAVVTEAPSGFYGLEFCLYKSGPNDAKHDCLPLAYRLMGTGEHFKSHKRTDIILRNILAKDVVSEDDFKTPWAANHTRLIGAEHADPITGRVKTRLTIVLVPMGKTFSGWANYPKK